MVVGKYGNRYLCERASMQIPPIQIHCLPSLLPRGTAPTIEPAFIVIVLPGTGNTTGATHTIPPEPSDRTRESSQASVGKREPNSALPSARLPLRANKTTGLPALTSISPAS